MTIEVEYKAFIKIGNIVQFSKHWLKYVTKMSQTNKQKKLHDTLISANS